MHWKCPKIGVLGDFGGENWNIYLSRPQKGPHWAKPRVLTYHTPKSTHGFDLGAIQRNTKNNVVGGHLGFSIFWFCEYTALFGIGHRLYMPNFIMIWLTVQKLLEFLFSIWNALKVPQNGVFGDFRGENWNIYLSKPQKAPPGAKPRVLTYHSPKSTHGFDRGAIPRIKKRHARRAFGEISPPPGDAIVDPIRTKFGNFIGLP